MAGTYLIEQPQWQVFADGDAVANAVATHIHESAEKAIKARGTFHLVVPGGTTPQKLLQKLRDLPLPWQAIHLYLTDERCVPVGHEERNDRMFDELLLPYVDLPPENIHRIPAELGPETGARRFAEVLANTPPFDLVILGVGEDGHTASLFPAQNELEDDEPVVAVCHASKAPPERVSLGLSRILSARERIAVATGAAKRSIIQSISAGETFPITRARPDAWYLDSSATG